jgi:hypothetical protein
VDLGIWTSGFSLQLPDLSIGIFIRVIGHFWQQGRVIEGFSLPLERDILQLESLAFRSACIDLHFLFSLWRHYIGICFGMVLNLVWISLPMHSIALQWYAMVLVLVCNGMGIGTQWYWYWYGSGIGIGIVIGIQWYGIGIGMLLVWSSMVLYYYGINSVWYVIGIVLVLVFIWYGMVLASHIGIGIGMHIISNAYHCRAMVLLWNWYW